MSLELAIVVPAYNEESNIGAILESLKALKSSVILIDDYSTDNTSKIASGYECTIIKNTSNMGYEASINSGLSYAVNSGYKFVATFDADGELSSHDLKVFLEK